MPQNGINYGGVMALASAIRHNPELRVLNFNDNTFTKRGTLAMAQVRHPPYRKTSPSEESILYPVCLSHAHHADSAGSEAPQEHPGDQLRRLSGPVRRSHRSRCSFDRRTAGPEGERNIWVLCEGTLYWCFMALLCVFRNSTCHSARSQRGRLLWSLRPSWTNLIWRKSI